jgi:hypothetical protein
VIKVVDSVKHMVVESDVRRKDVRMVLKVVDSVLHINVHMHRQLHVEITKYMNRQIVVDVV